MLTANTQLFLLLLHKDAHKGNMFVAANGGFPEGILGNVGNYQLM